MKNKKISHLVIYFVMAVVAINATIALGSVWAHNKARHLTYELKNIQGDLYRAKMDETRLRLEVAFLSSPARIDHISLQDSKKEVDTKVISE